MCPLQASTPTKWEMYVLIPILRNEDALLTPPQQIRTFLELLRSSEEHWTTRPSVCQSTGQVPPSSQGSAPGCLSCPSTRDRTSWCCLVPEVALAFMDTLGGGVRGDRGQAIASDFLPSVWAALETDGAQAALFISTRLRTEEV